MQQHVYDASQCMGDTQPPDLDVPVDSQETVPMDTQPHSGKGGKDLRILEEEAGTSMEVQESISQDGSSRRLQEEGQEQFGTQMEVQVEVHVDVESDGDLLHDVQPSNQGGENTANPPGREVISAAQNLQMAAPEQTSSATVGRNDSVDSLTTEQTKPPNKQEIIQIDSVNEPDRLPEKQPNMNVQDKAGPSVEDSSEGTEQQLPAPSQSNVSASTQPSCDQQHQDKVQLQLIE